MKRALTVAVVVMLASGALLSAGLFAQTSRTAEVALKAAQHIEEVEGDLRAAIDAYAKLTQGDDRSVAAQALVRMAACYQKLGDEAESHRIYERVVQEFTEYPESTATAKARLATLRLPDAGQTEQRSRLIWHDIDQSEDEAVEAPSPDGRYLSFTDGASGDLMVLDLKEGTTRRLTKKGSWTAGWDTAYDGLVSHDNRYVVYTWEGYADGKFQGFDLRVLPLGEEREPQVVHRSDETDYIRADGWTPDGRSLLVRRRLKDGTWQIAFISIADRSIRTLKSLEWRNPRKVSLSPDARFIAYDAPADADVPTRDIFVLAADGSRETVAVKSSADDSQPVWSPDGSHIVFVSNRTGSDALWAVNMSSGNPQASPKLVKSSIGRLLGMTRSGALYYLEGGRTRNVYTVDVDATMKVQTSPSVATERFVNSNGAPTWSPDGQYLAYQSVRATFSDSPGSTVLVIRSLKTGEERDIPIPSASFLFENLWSGLRWFPNARSLLVVSSDQRRNQVAYYRVDVATGAAELIHRTRSLGLPAYGPDLSPDGRSLFYIDGNLLMQFDLESRRETELLRASPGERFLSLAVSPNGDQLAYFQSGWLNVIPLGGGQPRKVYRTGGGDAARFMLAWTPDQHDLLFVRDRSSVGGSGDMSDDVSELWRVPVNGGEPERIGVSIKGVITSPRLDSGGRRLTFGAIEEHPFELWALENFLPPLTPTR